MSIQAMTTAAVGFRKARIAPPGEHLLRKVSDAERAGAADDSSKLSATLEALVVYIPTEVVTAYVAVLAAVRSDSGSRAGQWAVFWFFLIATPIAVWTAFAVKTKAVSGEIPLRPGRWPWWEIVASIVAYGTWAYTLPDAPFADWDWYKPTVGAALILIVTFVLGLVAPLFQPKPRPT